MLAENRFDEKYVVSEYLNQIKNDKNYNKINITIFGLGYVGLPFIEISKNLKLLDMIKIRKKLIN